ncbi:STAS domain-containing protein [Rhodocyclaceae bacterium SMB388]
MAGLFGNKSPAGKPGARDGARKDAPPRRGQAAEPGGELSRIDFSTGEFSLALADCADLVEVQEVGTGLGAIFEEVAILYANGNAREAEALLNAVLADESAAAGEGLWMMLLDLYQLTGQRERFESRVLDYATRFERSPPPWVDLSASPPRRKSDVVPLINLTGNLNGQAEAQFKQMLVIGQKSGAIRIDLKRLRTVDETGCCLLLDVVAGLARERARLYLLNCEGLITLVESQIEVGVAQRRPFWLLMLELLQHTGAHERFEQLALDYAITFEESPPSWEDKPRPTAAIAATNQTSVRSDDCCLEGELVGAGNESIRRLAALGAERQSIEIDCGQLRRMDFVCAGTLFNIVSSLCAQGKRVSLINVNAMVGALLRVMSVDQVAQVSLRR